MLFLISLDYQSKNILNNQNFHLYKKLLIYKNFLTIEDKINYFLYSEINPSLASHGGEVHLVEVLEQTKAVLRFGGGCQGCGMVDLTLKDGV